MILKTFSSSYEGLQFYKSEGCTIRWKEGKNVVAMNDNDSFFHFFRFLMISQMAICKDRQVMIHYLYSNEETMVDSDEEKDEDEENRFIEIGWEGYEVGTDIRDKVIPKAVLHFTGNGWDGYKLENSLEWMLNFVGLIPGEIKKYEESDGNKIVEEDQDHSDGEEYDRVKWHVVELF